MLPYGEAIAALEALRREGARLYGWEGWLRYPDDRLGHSERFQGTVDLSGLGMEDAYTLCHATIRQAQEEYAARPDAGSTELLFCLTIGED